MNADCSGRWRPNAVRTVCVAFLVSGCAAIEVRPGDDLRAALTRLGPGDELVLRGGTYPLGAGFRITANGTAAAPAVIRAKRGERPLIRQADVRQNVLEIADSNYLVVRGIAFSGGSIGIRLIASNDVTIEDCEIFETGSAALAANSGGTYQRLRLLRNHIHHTNGTGEGMYLGCNKDKCRVANSLIEGNYIHHTNRPTVDQGDGIEIKEGSYGNTVRDNVIHDTHYPGIITYSTVGNGPPNVIDGNVIWNTTDYSIQSAADAIIRNNIVMGSGVGFQKHQNGAPSNIEFVHNTVIARNNGVQVRDISGRVLIANNAIYCQTGNALSLISGDVLRVTLAGNVGQGGLSGGTPGYVEGNGIDQDFVAAGVDAESSTDVFPAPKSALIGAAAPEYVVPGDFNGTPREGSADAGAYRFNAEGNPGWRIGPGFKPLRQASSGVEPRGDSGN